MIVAGIDPGVETGWAEWDTDAKQLVAVRTLKLHTAWVRVLELQAGGQLSHVVFEDARMRTWFGNTGREKLQGAGSVKRDCKAWADFLTDNVIPYRAVSPQSKGAKLDAGPFARLTGWQAITSNHGRDAAMLVFQARALKVQPA